MHTGLHGASSRSTAAGTRDRPRSTGFGGRDHAIVMLDVDGLVAGWNLGAERLTGFGAAEVLGRSFDLLYDADEAERGNPAGHLAEARAAGHVEYEGWRVRKDGSRFWADVVLTAVVDGTGQVRGFGKVTRDATARWEAEQALRARERAFQALLAGVRHYAVVMVDPEGRVASWNAGAQELTGYPAEEVLGRRFEVFAPPEERDTGETDRLLAQARSSGSAEHTGWRLRRDGSRFSGTLVVTAVFDEAGRLDCFGTVTRDTEVTGPGVQFWEDHRPVESADILRAVDGVLSHAIVMLDRTGRVTGWNAGAERITGYPAAEVLHQPLDLFYLPEQVAAGTPTRHLEQAEAAGHLEYEGWRVRRDGTRFWADVVLTAVVDDTGRLRGFGQVTRDATARRTAEQALVDSEQQVRLLLDGVRDQAVLMLDPVGTVVGWNAGAELLAGYPPAEVLGRSFTLLYPPEEDSGEQAARHLADALAYGHVEYEGWRLRRDGSRFSADVTLTAVVDASGTVRGFGKVLRDATARRQAEKALQDSEERFRLLVASVRDHAIVMLDPDGQVVSWNAGAEHITGYVVGEVLGQPFEVFYPEDERSRGECARHLAQAVSAGVAEHEGWRVRKDGSRFWATVVITAVIDGAGLLRGLRTVTRDVTERRQLEAQLSHQALHDPLTGLGNRVLLVERLEHALTRLPRHPGLLALLFLDLDRFKLVNDTLGHEAGDELLVTTAALLREAVRPEDMVARFGGDEFVVLCEDLDGLEALEALAQRVTRALNVPVQLLGRDVLLSASVGVVAADGDQTAVQLLRDADAAMYQAKELGRGRYALFDEQSRAGLSDRLRLGSELHRALERSELRAHYQPLVDLRTGEVVALESLVRWQHPERGLLAPGTFLGIAEDLGTVVAFDTWMVSTACADAVAAAAELGRPLGVWANLSGRSLADPGLPRSISAALDASGLPPGLLTLEITEGALMRDAASTVTTLRTLRALGVHLAIDDFGTGYSSLAYLQKFPVHALKVDASFVARLDVPEEATASSAIIRAVVVLAESLELRTVAEGIETPAQLAAVLSLGCQLGQGYLLGRPGTAESVQGAVSHALDAWLDGLGRG